MPACASDNSRFFPSTPPRSRSSSASPSLPGSPLSSSPIQHDTMFKLKRSSSELSNSSRFSTWSRVSATNSPSTGSTTIKRNHSIITQQQSSTTILDRSIIKSPSHCIIVRLIIWYFTFIFRIIHGALSTMLFLMRAPAVWASVWLCIILVILQLPLTMLKYFITIIHTPASELMRNKRCVLISGGSTVQSVHLARNFYKAGARVIVCEIEDLFGLARFSTACSKFYTLPRPAPGNAADYVKALKNIVEREKVLYYIPVSSANAAYYDALAKPHLEIIGCECFVPSATEVTALDDPLELLRRCRSVGLTTPVHFVLRSLDDVMELYDTGVLRSGRHVMLPAGPAGMKDRTKKIPLPPSAREFQNIRHIISDKRPWVVIRDPGGSHYITCTTVKNSRVVANVTCRVDESKGLIPVLRNDVTEWLERFFARSFARVNGHMSFRLVHLDDELVAIGCRVGVGLPYVCLTSVHPRLVWRPCRHFSRQNSGPLLVGEKYDGSSEAFFSAIDQANNKASNCFGSVLDKREALFVYWDPLPYCAYYHLQLPFNRVAGALRAQPGQHNPPLAVVQ